MVRLIRWLLEILGILEPKTGQSENIEDSSKTEQSKAIEDWQAKLDHLKTRDCDYSRKLKARDEDCGKIKCQLDQAKETGKKAIEIDRLQYLYDVSKAAFGSMRRQVDSVRTNISRLSELIHMIEEAEAAGLIVDAEQYHEQTRKLYIAIQTQQEQLEKMDIADRVRREMSDRTSDSDGRSLDAFDLDSTDTSKQKRHEIE